MGFGLDWNFSCKYLKRTGEKKGDGEGMGKEG
jgi:hypothetical protein